MPTNAELTNDLEAAKARMEEIAKAVDDQGDAIDSLTVSAVETKTSLSEILAAINGMSARDRPTQMHNRLDTEAIAEASGVLQDLDARSDVLVESVKGLVSVDSPEFKAKADMLKFMEEEVTVFIHDTADVNADQNFMIAVNGRSVVFRRNEKRRVKRYIVEGLARAKPRQYMNQEHTLDDGRRAYKYPMRSGLRYGFTVVEDANPRGEAWLERLLQED